MYFFTGLGKRSIRKSFSVDEYIVVNIVIRAISQKEKLVPEVTSFFSSLALYLGTRNMALKKDQGEERTSKDCLLWWNSALIFYSGPFGDLIKYAGCNLCFDSNPIDILQTLSFLHLYFCYIFLFSYTYYSHPEYVWCFSILIIILLKHKHLLIYLLPIHLILPVSSLCQMGSSNEAIHMLPWLTENVMFFFESTVYNSEYNDRVMYFHCVVSTGKK